MRRAKLLLGLCLLAPISQACKKEKDTPDLGYGCDTKQVVYSLSNMPAELAYMNNQYQQAWFVIIDYPNNAKHLLKICNLDKASEVLQGANTSSRIPVYVSGDVKEFGPDELIGITAGIVLSYHVQLTSLRKQ